MVNKKDRRTLSWVQIFKYNRLILGALLLAMLLATKVLILVMISDTVSPKLCKNPICFQEAAKIKQYIDTNVNPCEDFYHFACGSFLKDAQGDEKLGYLNKFREQRKRDLLEIYKEPIHDEEHKMVKAAKKLFQACMNETEIERDNLKTIKEALSAVGGWPVVEGSSWNETNFDWLQASYKLRELGYHFSTFLQLEVQVDPDDKNEYILSVKPPNVWNSHAQAFHDLVLMTDVAIIFGAENLVKTSNEMIKVQDFLLEMQMFAHSPFYSTNSKFTVEMYQEEDKSFGWLEFVNNMARPVVHVSKNDFVLFPAIDVAKEWFRLLSKTPKRTQANYMMWKVIQEAFPYLTLELRKRTPGRKKDGPREEFCLRETEYRFAPSPAAIIYEGRHFSQEKKQQVKEQMSQMKAALVDVLNQTDWMAEVDKEEIIEKANEISLVFGTPGNWSNNKILDDLEVDMDMMENQSDTFLSLIAQATRNRRTRLYNNIKKSVSETLEEKWYIRDDSGLPLYVQEDDIIYIPSVALEGSLFHEETPRYLNYGAFGYQLGGLLNKHMRTYDTYGNKTERWSNHTKEALSRHILCMERELEVFQLSQGLFEIAAIIAYGFGQQVSYRAYEKWVENNGAEQKLSGLDYTPKQLFWISAATTFCQPISSNNSSIPELFRESTLISNIVSASKRNIPDFAKDFKCPSGSKLNPSDRCNFIHDTGDNATTIL